MSIERQAVAGLKWTASARLAGQLVSWGCTLAVLRLLHPEDYGLMAIVATIVGIGVAVADFGLSAAIIQTRELDDSILARLAGFVIAIHLGIGVLVAASGPFAAWFFRDPTLSPLLQVASLSLVVQAVGAVPHAMASRRMDFGRIARSELLSVVFGGLLSLGLAYHGFGVWSLVGAMVGMACVRTLLLVAGGDNVRPVFRFHGLEQQVRYGASMASSQVLSTVVNQADILIGGRLLAPSALGTYSVALHLATLPMQKVMGIINQVAFAAVARLQDEPERLRLRLVQSIRLLAGVAVGVMWGLCAVAPELVAVIIGPKWQDAVIPLQLISLVVPLRMVSVVLFTAAGGMGAANVNLRNVVTMLLVWPPCFVVGASWAGAMGLAAAWLVAVPLTFFANARRVMATLQIPALLLLRSSAASIVAGAAMLAAVLATRTLLLEVPAIVRLVALTALGAVVYLAIVLTLDRRLLGELRQLRGGRSEVS